MRKILSLIPLLFLLCTACAPFSQQPETSQSQFTDRELFGEDSILFQATTEYSDVHDIGIPKKTGQSAIIRLSQEDFSKVPAQELTNYLNYVKSNPSSDWSAIVIDEENAILWRYDTDEISYGKWDEEAGITEVLGYYEADKEGLYQYVENSNGNE